jgi:hypothetical protein
MPKAAVSEAMVARQTRLSDSLGQKAPMSGGGAPLTNSPSFCRTTGPQALQSSRAGNAARVWRSLRERLLDEIKQGSAGIGLGKKRAEFRQSLRAFLRARIAGAQDHFDPWPIVSNPFGKPKPVCFSRHPYVGDDEIDGKFGVQGVDRFGGARRLADPVAGLTQELRHIHAREHFILNEKNCLGRRSMIGSSSVIH